jgi:hypothetical protein
MLYKNLPENELTRVMRVRFILDCLAAIHYLLAGRPGNAAAICRARLDYRRMKPSSRAIRRENLEKTTVSPLPHLMPRSLILAFYLKGKKRYTDL